MNRMCCHINIADQLVTTTCPVGEFLKGEVLGSRDAKRTISVDVEAFPPTMRDYDRYPAGLNLSKELDKDTGVKRSLAEEFGSCAATPAKAPELDFLYVFPAKATKHTKATKDDKDAEDAKGEAYGRSCRGKRIVKDEYAAEKKKTEQAEAALKNKEKADARKRQADLKKQESEAKKKRRLM
ncbi:hypothetical protein Bca52824_016157 [Brassica carinata]|uniref:Uncharacterized protein n=1 Tax=Brassica carinata TaxID=52824 RepID=A0A8X8B3U0_BRACI|nr:hypothetical protein Bca52824_016157 [Brassica carinata]